MVIFCTKQRDLLQPLDMCSIVVRRCERNRKTVLARRSYRRIGRIASSRAFAKRVRR